MCVVKPVTESNLSDNNEACGLACPLCDGQSVINYMRFLDPHGVERVDPDIFECTTKRHSFTRAGGGLRVLAADGERAREKQVYMVEGSALVLKA